MFSKYEVLIPNAALKVIDLDKLKRNNTSSGIFIAVHLGSLISFGVLSVLMLLFLIPDLLWPGIISIVVFVAMTLIEEVRGKNIKKLKPINGSQCIALVEFLKEAQSQDVKRYVNEVKGFDRPFTVGEFEALMNHEAITMKEFRENQAHDELYGKNGL